ncbi:GntR family transcriptional regulator [Motilibacter rhizosphaerae]|uniref:GntR family transcriptional regulator n=1 Tax=Motilibacter rhizosphaerae TaxID=598652 RepID=A0A4Q7NWT3_9ACTN|nr:GntR family transcriptional regulator [Motilibacter rhizosphaerae]RZS91378.1 GntR family transcriptional regulator [Motilibacter rhizosphaerae]
MILEVDSGSPVPPYEQLRAQIADLVAAGSLPVGHRLPSIRQLAVDLDLAPGTVARAYRELESAGVVVSRVRHGTTVAAAPEPVESGAAAALLEQAAAAYARAVRRAGASQDQAVAALREKLAPADPPEALA